MTFDRRMSVTTRIYIGLVVASAIFILGAAVFLQDANWRVADGRDVGPRSMTILSWPPGQAHR